MATKMGGILNDKRRGYGMVCTTVLIRIQKGDGDDDGGAI